MKGKPPAEELVRWCFAWVLKRITNVLTIYQPLT